MRTVTKLASGLVFTKLEGDPCEIDPELGIMIHKFSYDSRVCRCGGLTIKEKEVPTKKRFCGAFGRRKKKKDSENCG